MSPSFRSEVLIGPEVPTTTAPSASERTGPSGHSGNRKLPPAGRRPAPKPNLAPNVRRAPPRTNDNDIHPHSTSSGTNNSLHQLHDLPVDDDDDDAGAAGDLDLLDNLSDDEYDNAGEYNAYANSERQLPRDTGGGDQRAALAARMARLSLGSVGGQPEQALYPFGGAARNSAQTIHRFD